MKNQKKSTEVGFIYKGTLRFYVKLFNLLIEPSSTENAG